MSAAVAEAAAAAFIIAAVVSPIVGAACKQFGILDHPGPLKIHKHPIPRLGGVAIAIAIAGGMLVGGRHELRPSLTVAAFVLVWFTGLMDDIRSLTPWARLISQIAAAFLVWRAVFGFHGSVNGTLSLVGTVATVIILTNSFNFQDGADGLAGEGAAIVVLAFLFAPGHVQDSRAAALAASVAAACGGFLIWNLPPAKLFMGDGGSTLLGFAVAFLTLDFYHSRPLSLSVALFPVFIASLPMLDAALAIIRRFRRRQSLVRGDRLHLYDLMLVRGCSSRRVALAFFGLTGALASLGWLAVLTQRTIFLLADAVLLGGMLVTAIRLGALGRTENTLSRELAPSEAIGSRPSL